MTGFAIQSLIMNNGQLFDLTSPHSAEFDTAQELCRYYNNHAKCSGNQKFQKREKYHNQM